MNRKCARSVIVPLLAAVALAAAPDADASDTGREAIATILKELGVDPKDLAGGEDKGAARTPGSAFSEDQRREIETMIDSALAARGILPAEGVGTVREPETTGDLLDAGKVTALMAVLSRFGTAEEGLSSVGAPFIVGEMEGVRYRLDFQDCPTPETCRDVLFTANFDTVRPTLEFLNDWNLNHRFGTATRDEDGIAWLQMPVNLYGGVSEANWSDSVDWWRIAAFEFRDALHKSQ